MELPDRVGIEEAITLLSRYASLSDAAEQVYVSLKEDGTVAETATVKPSNLRFNLGSDPPLFLWTGS